MTVGINLYRLFEASWLDAQGCPVGAVIEIETPASMALDTFFLKSHVDALQGTTCDSPAAYAKLWQAALHKKLGAALELCKVRLLTNYDASGLTESAYDQKASSLTPLRALCPLSRQPYLGLLWTDATDQAHPMEFAASHDNMTLSAPEVADAFYYSIAVKQPAATPFVCGFADARRGGIATLCLRADALQSNWQTHTLTTGIE